MPNQTLRINAGYILPVTSPPIQNGSILIKEGRIKWIGRENEFPNDNPSQTLDYPDHLIMPGLVNSHTHLLLSKLKNKIKRGITFTDWIKKIISYNNSLTETDERNAIREGIKSLIATGTTTIGDASKSGFSTEIMQDMKIRGIVFFEVIGFKKSAEKDQIDRIHRLIRTSKSKYRNFNVSSFIAPPVCACLCVARRQVRTRPGRQAQIQKSVKTAMDGSFRNFEKVSQGRSNLNDLVKNGLSPHSPYSVSPQLIQSTYQLAGVHNLPISMHIAETKEELEFIEKGEGALRKLLEDVDRWEPEWNPPNKTPIDYLNSLGALKGVTGIHLNHINGDDIKIIKKNKMSVVYCPKSNQWFQRESNYPLMKFLKEGINVAIGTDSLASNDTLNMFEEMALIKKLNSDISDETLLQMATINGARALGLEKETGSLEPGKKADIIGLKINNNDAIYKSIFSSGGDIAFSMVKGKMILKG